MPHTNAWDETVPAGTKLISTGDNDIRQLKLDIRERANLEHVWNVDTTNDGKHRNITVPAAYNAANTAVLTAAGGSRTGSNAQSEIDLATTWNTTGAPAGIKLVVTDTASDAASKFLDFLIGAVRKFAIGKDGNIGTLRGVAQVWPSSQGAANTVLMNDGSGNLSWSTNVGIVKNYVTTLAEVANTVSETTTVSFTVSANDVADGDIVKCMIAQTEQDTSGLGGTTTYTFKLYWGGTLIGTYASHAINDTLTRSHLIELILMRVGTALWAFTPIVITQGPLDPYNFAYSVQGGTSGETVLKLAAAGFAADKLVELKVTLSRANANVKYTPGAAKAYRIGV